MSPVPLRSAALVLLIACGSTPAQTQDFTSKQGPIRLVQVARGLEHPWSLAFLPDGRMLVTERPGRLRIVTADGTISQPLTGVPAVFATGQGGLLDVVLAPDFAQSRTIYLSYAEPGDGGAGTAVARARLGDAGLTEVRVIFRQSPKVSGGAHFGSRIVPARDGNLFITTGDRGKGMPAQDLSVHIGKLIRIRPDGTVPSDNPFVNRKGRDPRSGPTVIAACRALRSTQKPASSGPPSTVRWAVMSSTAPRRAATTAGR
jgi:glucose/arabinose dehydrogenase